MRGNIEENARSAGGDVASVIITPEASVGARAHWPAGESALAGDVKGQLAGAERQDSAGGGQNRQRVMITLNSHNIWDTADGHAVFWGL